ncbi:MAG: hypothetical protein ABI675_23045 [Chitinophagaceae bacterium]
MKKLIFYFGFLVTVSIIACNDAENEHNGHGKDNEPKTQADSLMKDLMDGHNIGMAKMGKLTRAEQTTRRLLDSVATLPAKARQAAEPFKTKLDSLQKELSYAEIAMDKWMKELKEDSAINNMEMEERIKYLISEKLKVTKVKEAILSGLQKADSLIKDKF